MAKLTADQVTELKTKGFITQVVASSELANNSVDELKIEKYITNVVPSADLEESTIIHVTSVTLDPTTLSLAVDGNSTITATVAPDDATNPTVTWSSSDNEVATVDDDGKVVGVKAGEATITATADGKSATCVVTVA